RAGGERALRRRIDPPVGNPKPGSWADLRQRLERLPYGHPSSPYHVDGERKPPPPRLKHLELAPPGREPSPAPSRYEFSDTGPADTRQSDYRTEKAATTDEAKPSAPPLAAQTSPGQVLPDRNGQREAARHPLSAGYAEAPEAPPLLSAASRPPVPGSEDRTSRQRPGAGPDEKGTRHRAEERPDLATGHRRTPAEMPRASAIQAHPPAERPRKLADAAASRPDPLTGTPRPTSGWRQQAATQAGDPTAQARSLGVGRGPGFNTSSTRPRLASDGSWSWGPARLTSEQVRLAQDGYERFRMAEGRDLFGDYGTSGLTAKLRQVEERLEN